MALTSTDISKAVSNTGYGTFEITNDRTGASRTFEFRDLDYDSYVEFCDLARPIITAVTTGFDISNKDGELSLEFNPSGLDYEALIKAAGKQLPRMAWLCCVASDATVTEKEIKLLARRPHALLKVVLSQIKHNDIIKEFQDFFPQLTGLLTDLAPQATAAMTPVSVQTPPTA